ncbi:hypothetical protein [Niveispirillum cyanobacteriorum]|uniref:hypothetical protein n=1 Tax=Niveispirillum cyanobacteriorum TaxID=1612173 RepID=UPI001319D55B|nr:hypothetical protein [Niveispirillum cyanobacteriorum]GGE84483.1 hypothetical protein GCM10011317_47030 [Niveispirillum cyanobacteriorum]
MSGHAARKPPIPARPALPAGPGAAVAQRLKTFEALRPGPSGGQQTATAGDPLVRATADRFQVRDSGRGVMVRPNGTYNFVRVTGETQAKAETLVSSKVGHAAIAAGRPVLYAGTARFDNGALEWWSNYSGTYQPMAAFKGQAGLPVERFQPWQKLQMGGVGMQRGTFLDRRDPSAPTAPEKPAAPAKPTAAPAPAAAKEGPAARPAVKVAAATPPAPVKSAPAPIAAKPAVSAAAPAPSAPVPPTAAPAPAAAPAQAKMARAGMAPPPVRWSGLPR